MGPALVARRALAQLRPARRAADLDPAPAVQLNREVALHSPTIPLPPENPPTHPEANPTLLSLLTDLALVQLKVTNPLHHLEALKAEASLSQGLEAVLVGQAQAAPDLVQAARNPAQPARSLAHNLPNPDPKVPNRDPPAPSPGPRVQNPGLRVRKPGRIRQNRDPKVQRPKVGRGPSR